MVGPYSVAHLKLTLKLEELGFVFGFGERLRIYLANTLEDPAKEPNSSLFDIAISDETKNAFEIRNSKDMLVVMGNPPYSQNFSNKNPWIESQMKTYKKAVAHEKNIQPLRTCLKFIELIS